MPLTVLFLCLIAICLLDTKICCLIFSHVPGKYELLNILGTLNYTSFEMHLEQHNCVHSELWIISTENLFSWVSIGLKRKRATSARSLDSTLRARTYAYSYARRAKLVNPSAARRQSAVSIFCRRSHRAFWIKIHSLSLAFYGSQLSHTCVSEH
jgi:hypothetical protein